MKKTKVSSLYDDVDKEYAAERNALIPAAEKYANRKCGSSYIGTSDDGRDAWNKKWSTTFIKRMDHLYSKIPRPCPTCGKMP